MKISFSLFVVTCIIFTFFTPAQQLHQKTLNWMYEQRESNTDQYREKNLEIFQFTQTHPPRYQPIFINRNNEFLMPKIIKGEQRVHEDYGFNPLCRSRTMVKKSTNEYAYKSFGYYLRGELNRTFVKLLLTPRSQSEYRTIENDPSINICSMTTIPTVIDKPKSSQKISSRSFSTSLWKQSKSEKKTEKYYDGKLECRHYDVGYGVVPQSTNSNTPQADANQYGNIDFMKKLYEVCYNEEHNTPLYTYHKLYHQGLYHRKINPNLNDVATPHMNRVHPHIPDIYDLYTQKANYRSNNTEKPQQTTNKSEKKLNLNEAETLDNKKAVKFLDEVQRVQKYIPKYHVHGNILVPVRLVPAYDMLYESWQYATNGYLNFSAQWRSVNLSSWLDVEEQVRHIAYLSKSDLHIYTGVGFNPKLNQAYDRILTTTDRKQIPIPDFFFKYIINDKNEGIVLVTMNNNNKEFPCTNTCVQHNWPFRHESFSYPSIFNGRTACCEPQEFLNQLPYEFDGVAVQNILKFTGNNPIEGSDLEGQTIAWQKPLVTQNIRKHIWEYATGLSQK